jgi:hypothetical protein
VSRALKSLAIFAAFVAIYTVSRHVVHSTPSTTTSTTIPHTTTTTPPSGTTTTLASTACGGSDFTGVYNEGEGAAGTIEASVTLTKTTAGSCDLQGWPILTLQDKLGAVLTTAPVDVPSATTGFQFLTNPAISVTSAANKAPASLRLSQGATTTFALAYSDVAVGTQACDNAVSLFVQFVKSGTPVTLTPAEPVQPCDGGQIWISPFYSASR